MVWQGSYLEIFSTRISSCFAYGWIAFFLTYRKYKGRRKEDPRSGTGAHWPTSKAVINVWEGVTCCIEQTHINKTITVHLWIFNLGAFPESIAYHVSKDSASSTVIILNQRQFIIGLLNELLDLTTTNDLLNRLHLDITGSKKMRHPRFLEQFFFYRWWTPQRSFCTLYRLGSSIQWENRSYGVTFTFSRVLS